MRVRLISFALGLFFTVFHIPSGFSAFEQEELKTLSLVQMVSLEHLNLERNLQAIQQSCKKEQMIKKSTEEIKKLMNRFPVQMKGDQKQLALYLKKIEFQRQQLLDCKI